LRDAELIARAQMEKKALSKPFSRIQTAYLSSVSPHDRQCGGSGRIDAGSVPAAVSQNQNLSWRSRFFNMAAPRSHEHLAHAPSQTKLKNISMEDGDEHDKEDRPERQYGSADLSLTGLVDRVSLEVAIAKLPQGYKRVFELHDVLGYEHNEIAEMLGFSVGNSKSQCTKPFAPAQTSRSRLPQKRA